MKKRRVLSYALMLFVVTIWSHHASAQSDDDIKKIIIRQSIASYTGKCPCPETRDGAGRRCGKRSAYLRQGCERPLCYPSDVTAAMVDAYRRNQR